MATEQKLTEIIFLGMWIVFVTIFLEKDITLFDKLRGCTSSLRRLSYILQVHEQRLRVPPQTQTTRPE